MQKNNNRFSGLTTVVDIAPADKLRLKEFMKQELAYYNALVEGLGPRTRTFPETILALHKDWENLFGTIAKDSVNLKTYARAKEDIELPSNLEPHRKMLVGKDSKGERFLNERMFNIMSVASKSAVLHPMVRKHMALLVLEYYKEQAGKLIKRDDAAIGDQDLYSKPIDLLVTHDMVTKRHLQIPRQALNDVRWIEADDTTEIYHPYSENPIKVPGHNLESNNHWNYMMIHQQPGTDAVAASPWVIDVKHSPVPYLIKYVDQDRPTTGKLFAIAKRRSY